jgi:hypothetical protein
MKAMQLTKEKKTILKTNEEKTYNTLLRKKCEEIIEGSPTHQDKNDFNIEHWDSNTITGNENNPHQGWKDKTTIDLDATRQPRVNKPLRMRQF